MNLSRPEQIRLQTMLDENWVFSAAANNKLMCYLKDHGLVKYRPGTADWCLTEAGLAEARKLKEKQ